MDTKEYISHSYLNFDASTGSPTHQGHKLSAPSNI